MLLMLVATVLCQEQNATASPLNGLVISDDRKYAFCVSIAGGMQAVRVEDGAAAWASQEARWPMSCAGSKLLAFGAMNAKRQSYVYVLDTSTGALLAKSALVTFPDWAYANLDYHELVWTRFRLWQSSNDSGVRTFHWQASYYPVTGVPMPYNPDLLKLAAGTITWNLQRNQIQIGRNDAWRPPNPHMPMSHKTQEVVVLQYHKIQGKAWEWLDQSPIGGDNIVVATDNTVRQADSAGPAIYLQRVTSSDTKILWTLQIGNRYFQPTPP